MQHVVDIFIKILYNNCTLFLYEVYNYYTFNLINIFKEELYMSKFGKVLLISGSVVAATALLAFSYKKLAGSMEVLNFKNGI